MTVDAMLDCKPLTDFLEAARNFCSFIEEGEAGDPITFLKLTENHLLNLYTFARGIPEVELSSGDDVDFTFGEKEIAGVLKLIGKKTPLSWYWAVLNPAEMHNPVETGIGDLIDDLGDIYQDLKHALILIQKNNDAARTCAIYHLKFSCEYHWGEHCIDALHVIRHYLNKNR